MKKCKGCGVLKELSEFAKDATKKDGHVNKCKACRCADSAARYQAKREQILAARRPTREAKRAAACAYTREWSQANPTKRAATQASYRARKRGAEGRHSAEDVASILALQRGRCACCKARINGRRYHVDHVLPLVLGGRNDRDNLQILCPPCNVAKGAKHPIDHARQLGRLL